MNKVVHFGDHPTTKEQVLNQEIEHIVHLLAGPNKLSMESVANTLVASLASVGLLHSYDDVSSSASTVPVNHSALETLEKLLQESGTEEEWRYVLSYQDYSLVSTLILFVQENAKSDRDLSTKGIKCLAYMGSIVPQTWVQYTSFYGSNIILAFTSVVTDSVCEMVTTLPSEISQSKSRAQLPYAGFDKRDVEDFNLDGHEIDLTVSDNSPASTSLVNYWLLILFHIYSVDILFGTESDGFEVESFLVATANKLLNLRCLMDEECLFLCIKCVAAFSYQFASVDALSDSTSLKIANLFASKQFEESVGVNISECLLHLLNETGYPSHESPETFILIKFCGDLLSPMNTEGFFYVNDLKILVDIIIREMNNLPEECINLRTRYFSMLTNLLRYGKYSESLQRYREDDIRAILIDFHGEEKGTEMFNIIDEML